MKTILLLFLPFIINAELSKNSSRIDGQIGPVNVSQWGKQKDIHGSVQAPNITVYYRTLNISDALDLYRIGVSIPRPSDYYEFGNDPILEVMVSNGRDAIQMTLPVVHSHNLTLYYDGKIVDNMEKIDFGAAYLMKNRRRNKNKNDQTLIITVQSRITIPVEFIINIYKFDKSQYVLRFAKGSDIVNNTYTGIAIHKPQGFLIDAQEQNIEALRLTVTSDSQICATLVSSPIGESLYEQRIDLAHVSNRRALSFTTRGDIYFTAAEISEFPKFRVFVFINPDNSICDPDATPRDHPDQGKTVTFYFEKIHKHSYFLPISAMLLTIFSPVIAFMGVNIHNAMKAKRRTLSVENPANEDVLIHFGSPGVVNEGQLINVTGDSHEQAEVDQVQVEENSVTPVQDSLSIHAEMLKYPIAIILPVFMHTAVEYIKWSTSSMANRDEMCFHNHACSQPYGEIRAINNIVSNAGYFFFGVLFIVITMVRRKGMMVLHHISGVYECTLIDVTIGIFMMMQAVASGVYHICPSDVAFQFDTPFIQVICGLLIIRQWSIRKESPSAAYSNFLLVAIVILNFSISALSKSPNIRIFLAITHLLVVAAVCAAKRHDILEIDSHQKKHSIIFCALFAGINGILMVLYAIIGAFHLNQISTYCFVVNCAFYLMYYTVIKKIHHEKLSMAAKMAGILAIVSWIFALSFFFQDGTDWTKSAAQSRSLNKPCVLLNFFGSHDMWHIGGAFASLFTFIYVSYVDDDISFMIYLIFLFCYVTSYESPESTPLRVLTFNIWNSGQNVEMGEQKIAKHILLLQPDIVALQEVYVNVTRNLTAMLGHSWTAVDHPNTTYPDTAILTRHLIIPNTTIDTDAGLGVKIMLRTGEMIHFWCLHLDYLSYGPYAAFNKLVTNIDQIMAGENVDNGRGTQILDILNEEKMRIWMNKTEDVPLIVAGDFNGPSHLDWIDDNRNIHGDWSITWPATKHLEDNGFTDTFRQIYPSPIIDPGITWSTVNKYNPQWNYTIQEPQDRIDFLFYKGPITPVQITTYCGCEPLQRIPYHLKNDYPSDHFAVYADYNID